MQIGFIGLGNMGGRIAARLLQADHQLVVHDVKETATAPLVERGARVAGSPKEVASLAEVVMLCLPTPTAVAETVCGESGVANGTAVRIVIDLSTSGPTTSRQIAQALDQRGVALLDAPVSGGTRGAEQGTLSVMTAGKEEALAQVRPLLETFGKHIFHLGVEPGLGQTMKLVNNTLTAASVLASFEGLVLGAKAGLDPQQMLDVINVSSGRSFATLEKIPQCVLHRNFPLRFTTDLLLKDVTLCLDEAEKLGVPMWVSSAVRQYLSFAVGRGDGPKDYAHVIKHLESWANVEFGKA